MKACVMKRRDRFWGGKPASIYARLESQFIPSFFSSSSPPFASAPPPPPAAARWPRNNGMTSSKTRGGPIFSSLSSIPQHLAVKRTLGMARWVSMRKKKDPEKARRRQFEDETKGPDE